VPDDRDFLRATARELRQPVPIDAAFDDGVMRAVEALPRHSRSGLWSQLTTPRTVTVKPLVWGLLAASLVAMAGFGAMRAIDDLRASPGARGGKESVAAGSRAPTQRSVRFALVAPDAKRVAVVGDFNGWDARHAAFQATHDGKGVWSVTAPVPAGHYRYSFVVDDSLWMADPTAPKVIDNDFGLPNSAIVVGDQAR
jgi:Carbohydrate-binding module 48 (Isoamylase N-terminal domain)